MKIKRFTGTDMRTVMREVREQFGPDAVILETGRGDDGVELTAAMDFDPGAYTPPPAAARIDHHDDAFVAGPLVSDTLQATQDSNAELELLRAEMQNIRSLLEAQLTRQAWLDRKQENPALTGAIRNLSRLGLDADVVKQLLADAPDGGDARQAWSASLRTLVDHLDVIDDDLVCTGGIFAIVGPTGVGKTTTIAKLAARYLAQGRHTEVALVTTDTYRIGAREQLETFGRLLNVPVYQAGDAEQLSAVLAGLADKRLVLIDTAGMSQRDLKLANSLRCIADAEQQITVLLGLPANAQRRSMQEIVDAFRTVAPAACILTKMDEATSLGGALSVLIRSALPLAYVTNGQRVPEDLHTASARQAWLVKAAVELIDGDDEAVNDDYLAENFMEVNSHACA
jgi:flagellar biosynthesis protein FlhF